MRSLLIVLAVLVTTLVIILTPANAAVAHDEPEIDAYVTSSVVPAGQTYPLQVVVVNTAKHEWAERGSVEEELLFNASLTAYNVTLWLEGDEGIDVKTDRVRIPVLPSASFQPGYASRTVTFLISVSPDAVGKHTLKLHVSYERARIIDVTGNISGIYDVVYYYIKEEKVIPIEVEVCQSSKPILKAFPVKSRMYTNEVSQLVLQIANEGNGVARNVEVKLSGDLDVLDPKTAYAATIPPSTSVPVSFSVKSDKETCSVRVEMSYEYFDGLKWVRGVDEDTVQLFFEPSSAAITISWGDNEVVRGQKGLLDLYIMNSLSYPVSALVIQLEEPDGVDLKINSILVGFLNPGEVRAVKIPFEVDDEAKFGYRTINVSGTFRQAIYPSVESLHTSIPVYIKPEPDFEIVSDQVVYAGEDNQIVEVRIVNNGGDAKDIHALLKPSPGILVKVPDAFIESLKSGESKTLKFKVDVDEDVIPGTKYRVMVELTSEDLNGDEQKETEYFYVRVEEKGGHEYVLVLILALVLAAIAVYKKKRKKI
ncbi:COG1361 S-layer family protein [Archaeoglobus veneficus]|uniref:S-layer domain-like protein n=1 Tax=Archaeoglobus veneficus (strain DSM 11195 / SNP6) TaxID=693661 RepID=F2KPW2_ARCVS|nr:hypothetical protein [Archaeoglobus veneficus]AEA46469.1 hypothetical protein Arcve_0437 [Archaeoglobus veneficus SNP6]